MKIRIRVPCELCSSAPNRGRSAFGLFLCGACAVFAGACLTISYDGRTAHECLQCVSPGLHSGIITLGDLMSSPLSFASKTSIVGKRYFIRLDPISVIDLMIRNRITGIVNLRDDWSIDILSGFAYSLGRQLGSGAYGTVNDVVDYTMRGRRRRVVAKSIKIVDQVMSKSAAAEIAVLSTLGGSGDSAYIVQFMSAFLVFSSGIWICRVVMGRAPGATLLSALSKTTTNRRRIFLPTVRVDEIILAVARVVQRCHAIGVSLGDLKSENILVSWTGGPLILNLVDFGCSSFNGEYHDVVGTYTPP